MSENTPQTKCGFTAVIGLPNAGKSTLVNAMVGAKVSIVSRKVQTTRSRVLGILMQDNTQIILVDTPGVFAPKKTLEKAMVRAAWDAVPDADIILHIVDVSGKNPLRSNEELIKKLPEHTKCILVLNKVDLVHKEDLLSISTDLNERFSYDATFMISALKKKGIDDITTHLSEELPNGPYLFDEDQMSDMPLRMMASEITREKIYDQLHQELPYSIMVQTENWEDFENGSIKISQVVIVARDSQKGIVLGKGGSRIKSIGEQSRRELEEILETRVHLKLFVQVKENWMERAENYALMGLEFGS